MFIYVITNNVNGRQYVGQAKKPDHRWRSHCSAYYGTYKSKLYCAMRKYGIENFTFEVVLCVLRPEFVNQCEIDMIAQLDTFRNGYNATLGGQGSSGCKCTPERKRKIALSKIGKKRSLETVEKMRLALTGRKQSLESNEKRRRALIGRYVSAETRAKISKIHKGKVITQDHRERIRRRLIGSTLSAETRMKIAAANCGTKRSIETRRKLSRKAKIREQKKRESGYRVPDELRKQISETLKRTLAARRVER